MLYFKLFQTTTNTYSNIVYMKTSRGDLAISLKPISVGFLEITRQTIATKEVR